MRDRDRRGRCQGFDEAAARASGMRVDEIDDPPDAVRDGSDLEVEEVGARILEKIIAVASGERTKSELAGIGDEEFAPWILGPIF